MVVNSTTAGARGMGACEILAKIGERGMGEVYRARDTRLKRDVALKVLPEAFARDPDRVSRFEREAELLVTLTVTRRLHYASDARLELDDVTEDSPTMSALAAGHDGRP